MSVYKTEACVCVFRQLFVWFLITVVYFNFSDYMFDKKRTLRYKKFNLWWPHAHSTRLVHLFS